MEEYRAAHGRAARADRHAAARCARRGRSCRASRRSCQESSDKLSKATIDVVALEEKLMLARIKFQDGVADLSLETDAATGTTKVRHVGAVMQGQGRRARARLAGRGVQAVSAHAIPVKRGVRTGHEGCSGHGHAPARPFPRARRRALRLARGLDRRPRRRRQSVPRPGDRGHAAARAAAGPASSAGAAVARRRATRSRSGPRREDRARPAPAPPATVAPPAQEGISVPGTQSAVLGQYDEYRRPLGAFTIDQSPVSAAEYDRCVAAGKCTKASCTASSGTAPASCVDLAQARAYCESEGRRLPTEDEWEHAARDASRLGLRGMTDGRLEWTGSPYCFFCGKDDEVARGGPTRNPRLRSWRPPTARDASLGFRCAD